MPYPLEPQPWDTPLIDTKPWALSHVWKLWLDSLRAAIVSSTRVLARQILDGNQAAIAQTTLTIIPSSGFVRVSLATRVTQAATTSSSLEAIVRVTSGGVVTAYTTGPITGNTIGAGGSFSLTFDVDALTGVTLETTYSSTGATPMQYRVAAVVEEL